MPIRNAIYTPGTARIRSVRLVVQLALQPVHFIVINSRLPLPVLTCLSGDRKRLAEQIEASRAHRRKTRCGSIKFGNDRSHIRWLVRRGLLHRSVSSPKN